MKRKGLRNKARAKQRQEAIKKFTRLPPIQKVDVEAIKEEFAKKSGQSGQPKKEATANASADEPKSEAAAKEAPKSDSTSEKKATPDTTAEVRETRQKAR